MKLTASLNAILFVICCSCTALNVNEIENLVKAGFEPLTLKPGKETNNLRIDIIRQTYTDNVNDSVKETKDTPYHPLGFDLGNGLFYDLNKNLTFRLDYLMDYSSESNFEIHKIRRPGKNRGMFVYRFKNDSLTVSYPPGKKAHEYYHRKVYADSISYLKRNRMLYAIVETDTSMIYSGKRRKWDIIHKLDENHYFVNKKSKTGNFQIVGNELYLENKFRVCLTNQNLTLEVKSGGKKRNRVLYTIERSKDAIYIYNKHYAGNKIELDKYKILIYSNKTFITEYDQVSSGKK
jgi:hypothetical protein